MDVTRDTTLIELYSNGIIGVRSYNCCRYSGIATLHDAVKYFQNSSFRDIRNCGKKSCEELEAICNTYSYLFPEEKKITQQTLEDAAIAEYEKRLSNINEVLDDFFEHKFRFLYNKLSVRGKNAFDMKFNGYKDLIKYFDYSEIAFKRLFETKKKTAGELFALLTDFRNLYFQYSKLQTTEIKQLLIEDEYPFLLTPELSFMQQRKMSLGRIPMLYVTKCFFNVATDKHSFMFSQYYGINNDKPKSLDEIAALAKFTRERSRQIISSYSVPDNVCCDDDERWNYYRNILPYVITKDSPLFTRLVEEEAISNDFVAFSGLLNATLGYSIISFHNIPFLVKNEIKDEARVAIKRIVSIFETKYPEDTYFKLSQVFPIKNERTKQLFIELIKILYSIEIDEDELVFIPQGRISIENEIINVLKAHGEPLSIDQIFKLFKDKYPEHKFVEPKSLRQYIITSNQICSRGKSGLYGLLEWNFYTGSIRDYAYELLEKEALPLTDEELSSKVLEMFPTSNHNSIISSLMTDTKERFIHFQKGYMGISSKKYPCTYIPVISQTSFEDRIRDLQIFLEKYQRFPFSDGGEFESSLYRWMQRYLVSNQNKNTKEYVTLSELLKKYEHCPHTEKENKFLNLCIEYKHFIMVHYSLPKRDSEDEFEKKLANWFLKAHLKINSNNDNISNYYNDLISTLRDLGFFIE